MMRELFSLAPPPKYLSIFTAEASSLEATPGYLLYNWRVAQGCGELDASERDLVVAAMKRFDGQRYELGGYVVMDDHVHVLASCGI